MATIEHWLIKDETIRDWAATAESSLLRGQVDEELTNRAKLVFMTKWIGRVIEAVGLGATLFERVRDTGGLVNRAPAIVAGLRAAITAAIARPEVPVHAVRDSIEQLRTWLVEADRPAAICDHLTLDLDATLEPGLDVSRRARALASRVFEGDFELHCGPCAVVRLAWRCRSTLAPGQLERFVQGARKGPSKKLICNADRFPHLVAQSYLERGLFEPAESAYGRAVEAWEAPVLPLPLVSTGIELAVRQGHRADLSERLRAFDQAVVDYEYPYIELSRRQRLSTVVPRTRRRFHAVNRQRLVELRSFVAQRQIAR
ncbi:MAG: hypothetical protein Q8N26_35110 [Myxococcales bacterium]|nr:hypothetical protein [Myxococcales bacterium]